MDDLEYAFYLNDLISNLEEVIELSVLKMTFNDDAYENLPEPWIARKLGMTLWEVKELNLQSTAYLIYKNLTE